MHGLSQSSTEQHCTEALQQMCPSFHRGEARGKGSHSFLVGDGEDGSLTFCSKAIKKGRSATSEARKVSTRFGKANSRFFCLI